MFKNINYFDKKDFFNITDTKIIKKEISEKFKKNNFLFVDYGEKENFCQLEYLIEKNNKPLFYYNILTTAQTLAENNINTNCSINCCIYTDLSKNHFNITILQDEIINYINRAKTKYNFVNFMLCNKKTLDFQYNLDLIEIAKTLNIKLMFDVEKLLVSEQAFIETIFKTNENYKKSIITLDFIKNNRKYIDYFYINNDFIKRMQKEKIFCMPLITELIKNRNKLVFETEKTEIDLDNFIKIYEKTKQRISKKEISQKKEKYENYEIHAGKWLPNMEDMLDFVLPNIDKYIDFIYWIYLTNTGFKKEQKPVIDLMTKLLDERGYILD